MTLILVEGFDYTTSNAVAVDEQFARFHNSSDSADALRSSTGRDGGMGMYCGTGLSSAWVWLQPPGHEFHDTWIVGFNWKTRGTGAHSAPFFRLGQSGVAGLGDGVQLEVLTNNTIEINDGDGNQLAVTANEAYVEGTWIHMELKAKCHATTGTVELRINGVNVASATSVNTSTVGLDEWASAILCGSGASTRNPIFDDLYICNDQGSTNNDFLGECYVRTLRPTSDAGTNDGTPSTGTDHYALVDEVTCDEDTTYVAFDTHGDKEMYGYETLSANGLIFGLAMGTAATTLTACDVRVNQIFESGAVESSQDSRPMPSNYYYGIEHVQEANPDTGSAWTTGEVNAGTFGCELDVQ